jgi:leucyl-tRNA synthetase
MVVQVNGKVRGRMTVPMDTTKEEMEEKAKSIDNVQKFIEGHDIVNTIIVPSKLVNIVIK